MDPIKWLVGAPGFEDVQNFNDVIFHQTIFSGYLGHLWSLPTLFGVLTISFLCILFSYRIFKKLNHTYIHFTLFIIFLLLHYYASHLPTQLCISSIAYYLIYSHTGLCFNALITNKQLPSTKKAQYISLLCWAISFICSIYFVKTRVIFIIIFITLSYILLPSRTNKFINNISNNSYGIYLFHSPLIYITYTYFTNADPKIVLFINFVVMGSLAYLLTIITNKSKLKFIIGN